jgi:hypothetical protein
MVEHLRLIMGELQVAGVRAQVGLSLFTAFEVSLTSRAGLSGKVPLRTKRSEAGARAGSPPRSGSVRPPSPLGRTEEPGDRRPATGKIFRKA